MPPPAARRLARRFACVALALAVAACARAETSNQNGQAGQTDKAGLESWKKTRDERLRRPDGWLTLVGLAWLEPGENAVGTAPGARVRLPEGAAPAALGTIRVENGRATFTAAPGVAVTVDGKPPAATAPAAGVALIDDADPAGPTIVAHGPLSFFVIARNGRLAVRVKDSTAATLAAFRGLEYFPADERWRVEGRFEPAPAGATWDVPNALGYVEKIDQPGWVEFELDGRRHRLIALDDTDDGRLFLVFGDRTNGRDTYGGGRFLYTEPPREGRVTIDFNRAYNPPCVFTPYATCPLPPPGNKLPLAIEAGEKKYVAAVHP